MPKQAGNALTGKGIVSKCTFCQDRATSGVTPACAKTCPPGAISFGERAAMLELGKERVDIARSKGYSNAVLYGENELGGLGMMYVLLDKPSIYGLPESPAYNRDLIGGWQGVKPLWYLTVGGIVAGSFVHLLSSKVQDPALMQNSEEGEK